MELIKQKKKTLHFVPWDIDKEQDPQTYIKQGYIDIANDVAFKYSYLACNCFGHDYSGLQRGGTKHPNQANTILWFPKLYPNFEWKNTISDDDNCITEISSNAEKLNKHIIESLNNGYNNRVVFARVKSPLGDVMYRFKGEYELDRKESNFSNGLIWKRIKTRVKTY